MGVQVNQAPSHSSPFRNYNEEDEHENKSPTIIIKLQTVLEIILFSTSF